MAESPTPDRMDTDVRSQTQTSRGPGLLPQSHGGHQGDQQSMPGLTHRTTSASTSKSKSTSALGRAKAMEWDIAARINRCRLDGTLLQENQQLETLRAGIKYPRAIREGGFVEWVTKNDNKRYQDYKKPPVYPYNQWLGSLQESYFESNDTYEVGALRTNLYKYWDHHLRAIYNENSHETEIRDGVEDMIKLAFETRLAGRQTYRAERELFLPQSPFTATADTVTWMPLPDDWYKFLAKELRDTLYVFASNANNARFVITFVCEYKVSDTSAASRQLTLDLCSVQNQRRALGFNDGQLFGAILVGNTLTMYVSEWEGDEVVVTPTTTFFELNTFHAFLGCYIFLCRLADRVAEDVQKVFAKWSDAAGKQDLQQKNRNAAGKPWRLADKPEPASSGPSKKRSRTGQGSQGGNIQDDIGFPDWEPFEEQNEGPLLAGGDPLVEANVRVLNKASTISAVPPAKDIPSWARQSAGSCADAA